MNQKNNIKDYIINDVINKLKSNFAKHVYDHKHNIHFNK